MHSHVVISVNSMANAVAKEAVDRISPSVGFTSSSYREAVVSNQKHEKLGAIRG